MTQRANRSEVKFKVRHNALLLHEFTTAEMVRATGCNIESVRTELQRMKEEGLLTGERIASKGRGPGGPPMLHRLTSDPEGRQRLLESVQAFYPPPVPTERPTSRYYVLAQHSLERASVADEQQRKLLLSEAERDLEMAAQAEGGSLAPESVKAYLQYEGARLAYLRGEDKEARRTFERLRPFFVAIQDEMRVRFIDEYVLCIDAEQRLNAAGPGSVSEMSWARCLLETLQEHEYQTDSPLVARMRELLSELTKTIEEKIRDAAYDVAKVRTQEISTKAVVYNTSIIQVAGVRRTAIEATRATWKWQVGRARPRPSEQWDLQPPLQSYSLGGHTDD